MPASSLALADRRHRVLALPRLTTSPLLLGRDDALRDLTGLLRRESVHLVTLTGPGGVGKTRLAVEVARRLDADMADGVAVVALSAIRDPALAVSAIAQAIGVRESGGQTPLEAVRAALAEAELLLVLDNLEQVLPLAPRIVELLSTCPGVKVLATSRAPLRVSGEQEVPVAPLPTLAPATASTAEIAALPAVRLFVERATAVSPAFALTDANARAVAEICHRVDGIPLAIELAAARSKILAPAALLARLERRLPLLTSGPHDQPLRLQTMRGAFDWSHELLDPDQQRLFRRLAVFAGGFDLAAAEAVSGEAGEVDGEQGVPSPLTSDLSPSTLDLVGSLVDQSLLQLDEDAAGGETRFRMLETVREYAAEHLAADAAAGAVRDAHASHVLARTEQAEAAYLGGEDGAWLARLAADRDNIRAALAWLIERQHAEHAFRLGAAAVWLWFTEGQFTEGRAWLDRVLSPSWAHAARTAARAKALFAAGMLAHYQGDQAGTRAVLAEGEALSRAVGDQASLARSLLLRGVAAEDAGDYETALPLIEEALALFQARGDRLWVAQTLVHFGVVAFGRGDLAEAAARCEEGLAVYRTVGDKLGAAVGIAGALDTLGLVACARSDHARALDTQRQALALRAELDNRWGVASSLAGLATVAAATAQPERAARLFGAAEALREASGAPVAHPERDVYDAALARVRARLPAEAVAAAWTAGRALPLEAAVAEGMAMDVPGAPPAASASHGLTPRELEVLLLLADGAMDKEIAEALFISPRTAMRHVANIFAKLGVGSRAAAAAHARRHGLA